MPLEEIKNTIELMKANDEIDKEKVEKHVEQIAAIMEHLKEEIKLMEPFLQKLNSCDKELVVSKLSPQGITLAQSLLLLLN
jgi:MerR family transcriptional regulator, copper efflux regulator